MNKVDRGANDISNQRRRQPLKLMKGDFAEGLTQA